MHGAFMFEKFYLGFFQFKGLVVLLQVGRVYYTLKLTHMLSRHHVRAQSSCCTLIMSHHALVGTPPGSLPCDCFSFPLATNMATGGGLSYPLGPGCCMCAQKFFFSANLSVGAIQPKRGLPKVGAIQPTSGWGYPGQQVIST